MGANESNVWHELISENIEGKPTDLSLDRKDERLSDMKLNPSQTRGSLRELDQPHISRTTSLMRINMRGVHIVVAGASL